MKDMSKIMEIITAAQRLGIKLTAAKLDTEICEAWLDRVQLAAMHFERGDMAACQTAIDDADRYAI